MYKYKILAYVNGIRTEAIVSANNSLSATKLFQAQYSGARIQIVSATKL